MVLLRNRRDETVRILRRLGHRPEDVEDGAQEVLMELMSRERVDGGLVWTVARFASLTMRKAEGRRARLNRGGAADREPAVLGMKNAHVVPLSIVGDIYVVPNHTGSMVLSRIGRAVDGPTAQYSSVGKSGQ